MNDNEIKTMAKYESIDLKMLNAICRDSLIERDFFAEPLVIVFF